DVQCHDAAQPCGTGIWHRYHALWREPATWHPNRRVAVLTSIMFSDPSALRAPARYSHARSRGTHKQSDRALDLLVRWWLPQPSLLCTEDNAEDQLDLLASGLALGFVLAVETGRRLLPHLTGSRCDAHHKVLALFFTRHRSVRVQT